MILRVNATATAIIREASNASLPPLIWKRHSIRLPSLGKTAIVAANIGTLLVLCFYKFDLTDQWSFEDIGYRTGCISLAQLPLIFLLAGKNNFVGWLTGTSYERLNWLHRWVSRCLLLTVLLHMGYWFADWAPYNYIGKKVRTDDITQHGLISGAILLWIVISSVSPIRGWKYEFFVIQHLGSMAVFLAFVYMHVSSWPMYVRIYIWIPIALVCFDRFVRGIWVLYTNLSFFHPQQRNLDQMSSLWACKADFTPLPHDTTRITIYNPPVSWRPGQHVFLSCHTVVPLQSHPFTIASIPADGKMEFYVRSEKGATARFFRHASTLYLSPSPGPRKSVAIDGPYGRMRPLRQFDRVVLFAGGTGATFTVPLLRDIVAHWKNAQGASPDSSTNPQTLPPGAATRHVRFIWVVRSRDQLSWFAAQLSRVAEDVAKLREAGQDVAVDVSVYVTCDPSFTDDRKTTAADTSDPAPALGIAEMRRGVDDVDEKQGVRISQVDSDSNRSSASSLCSTSLPKAQEKQPQASTLTCGPTGCCCRQTTTEYNDDYIHPAAATPICTCYPSSSPSPSLPTNTYPSASPSIPPSSPTYTLLSGRPLPRHLLRTELERALGETAVVVCGPPALAQDVRRAVCALSDERAVHRGTGAQGVWLHVEGFGV